MAQLVVAAVGAAIGNAFLPTVLGISGAGIGWALGSFIGTTLVRPKYEKPPVGDLSAPQLQYGAPLPRVWGTVATAGSLAWMSEKRAVEQTTEVGKGGGSTVTTGYNYFADMMFVVAAESGDNIVLTRAWRNGKLVYSRRAGATPDTYVASDTTDLWDEIELRDGNAAQTPWPLYEAAVGAADALAYRRRATICITNARFGSSPTPPAYLFEIATNAAETVTPQSLGTIAPGGSYVAFGGAAMDGAQFKMWLGQWTTSGYSPRAFDIVGSTGADPQVFVYGTGLGGSDGSASVVCASGHTDVPAAVVQIGNPGANNYLVVDSTGAGAALTLSDYKGSSTARWARRGSSVYIGGQAVGNKKIDKYGTAGGSVIASSAVLADYVEAIAATDTTVYALSAGATTIYVLDATTMASGSSITPPETDSQASLLTYGSTLYFLSTDKFYRWAGAAWVQIASGLTGTAGSNKLADHKSVHAYDGSALWTARGTIGIGGSAETVAFYRAAVAWEPGTVDLEDVVQDLCTAAPPLASAVLNTTALAGIPVRGFAAVGSPREALEQLASAHFFGCTSDSKLKFRLRGGAAAATIPYADLAAGVGQAGDEPIGLARGNDREIPRKVALTYSNWNADHEQGTVTGDRGAGSETQVDTAELAMVLTPTEAQVIADAWAMDRRAAGTTLRPALTDYYAALEPTDVVTVTDGDGTTYRARVVAEDYAANVKALECVLDDASVFTQPGLASDYTTPSISLVLPSDTTLRLMDIPLLRDADNDPGYYYAVARSTPSGSWAGASVNESADGTTYAQVSTVTSEATMGTATTTLAAWTGGNVMDHTNTVTISINGTAASYTDDQVLAGTARAWLIGDEILYARNATLVSTGVYTLSNLLRYQRGTEWAVHAGGERVVALDAATLRRGARDAAQLGLAYSFKAPSFGRSLASAAAQSFADSGEALRPLSPADVEVTRNTSNDATITIRRRTRLSHRLLTAGIDAPLGEAAEAYSVDVYSTSGYTTIVRTLTAAGTNVLTYSAASQTADGLTPGATLYLAAYQVSAVIGRGHQKRAAA